MNQFLTASLYWVTYKAPSERSTKIALWASDFEDAGREAKKFISKLIHGCELQSIKIAMLGYDIQNDPPEGVRCGESKCRSCPES